jgi:hypothetical protein
MHHEAQRASRVVNLDDAVAVTVADAAPVMAVDHLFDARYRACRIETEQAIPVVRIAIRQHQAERTGCSRGIATAPEFPRRLAVNPAERVIEAPHTAEAGGDGYVLHR